jgi:tRNA 2-thiouridine synthesizing protein A
VAEERLTVDARGFSCPMPVLKTKRALESIGAGWVEVIVDEHVSVENIGRLVAHMGYSHQTEADENGWRITIHKPEAS